MDINDSDFWNKIKKEYVAGRKDQFDLDCAVFRRAVEETKTREELITLMNEKCSFIITRIASERAKDLMKELELI
ncbi:MAG: hypothetical protein M1556_01430 [Candidatus Thermoplasmatota archaeon]|nr:hypothetical protein [Candidatus Thermoplasmatota archaeon]MCL6002297.1 hypothetical protein [Candidatus Thermoplasmatota archaeon]